MTLINSTSDEQLIAKGNYRYYQNDQLLAIEEPWTIHKRANGDTVTRATRIAEQFNNRIQVERLCSATQTIIQLLWQQDNNKVTSTYAITNNTLTVERSINDSPQQTIKEDISNTVVSPLMRIFTGEAIEQLIKTNNQHRILVPWIRDPQQTEMIATPLISERQATFVKEDKLTVDEQLLSCHCYEYSGGEYSPGTLFWLDHNNILLRYVWQQDEANTWDTRLTEYQHYSV